MRTNTKITTKFYDQMEVNGWALAFEYESINEGKPAEIRVNGTKGSGSLNITKNVTNTNMHFGGNVAVDVEVVTAVQAEFEAIEAEFEVGETTPSEGE